MHLDHSSTNEPVTIIESAAAWDTFIAKLKRISVFAIDIESNGFHCYPEKICLIQIAFQKQIYLIDTVKLTKLPGLKAVLENKEITKVFHSCENDVRAFQRDYHIRTKNIFDTSIAAKILGGTHLGLANTLQNYLNITLTKNKKIQKQNWSKRPLDQASLEYAADDVNFLIPLKSKLERQLIGCGRLTWFKEECQLLEKITYQPPYATENLFWNVKGVRGLTPKQRAKLKELCIFRENFALEVNQPPYRLLSDATLKELVTLTKIKMANVKKLGFVIKYRKMQALHQALKQGNAYPPIALTQSPNKPNPPKIKSNKSLLKDLKQWREEEGLKLEVDPSIIWPMQALEQLACHPERIHHINELENIRKWQKVNFFKSLKKRLELLTKSSSGKHKVETP